MAKSRASLLELRVLAGPQAGARAPLARGPGWRIGGGPASAVPVARGPASDILLHSPSGFMVQLDWAAGSESAVLCLVDGAGRLGDAELAVGAQQAWPMRQPLVLGEVVLAYGPADEPVWTETPAETPAAAPAPTPAHPAPAGLERWLLTGGAALAVACVGLLFLVDGLPPAQAGLSSAMAPALPIAPHAGATPAGTEDRARAVAEVFRLHGIAVQAQPRADGSIVVQAQERDSWRVEQAEKAARRDVPGLGPLTVRNQPPTATPGPRPPLQADAGKRITAVVADSGTPYFVTADGSRYFIGALLPSGHRVLQIAEQAVTVERDGQLTRLTL
jgi:hypothetical protein